MYTFFFSPSKPLKHIAGQHGLFILPRLRGVHIFSLSSAPEEECVTISTHVREESKYKQYLDSLKEGDKIYLNGPVLNFTLRKDVNNYVLLAQGIGITPFRSMLVHASSQNLRVKTTLVHVDNANHIFHELTEKLASEAHYPADSEEFNQNIKDMVKRNKEAAYYISGSPHFVKVTKETLAGLGIGKSRMKSDNFLGY